MATVKKYWNDFYTSELVYPVTKAAMILGNQGEYLGYPEYVVDTFKRFMTHGASAVDMYVRTQYPNRTMLDDVINIIDWLYEREPFIRKQFEYADAEYNPIENYSGHEHEQTIFDGGARSGGTTSNIGTQLTTYEYDEDKTEYLNPQHNISTQHAESEVTTTHAKKVTDTSADKTVTTGEVSPFEGGWRDKERTTVAGQGTGGDIESKVTENYPEQVQTPDKVKTTYPTQANTPDKVTYSEYTNTTTRLSHDDKVRAGAREDSTSSSADAFRDTTHRTLDKNGNIGIQTAADMMMGDERWWRANTWLRFLAKELVSLISIEVEAI